MKKTLALLMAIVMLFALAACGKSAEPAATEAPTEAEAPVEEAAAAEEPDAEAAGKYVFYAGEFEGKTIGIICVPADWDAEFGCFKPDDTPLPVTIVQATLPGSFITLSRVGPDAYEAAGVPMPADVEEYSQRSGPQGSLQEGEEYTYDELGNLCFVRETTDEDGNAVIFCLCLKQGTDCMGSVSIQYPADMEIDLPYILANSNLA